MFTLKVKIRVKWNLSYPLSTHKQIWYLWKIIECSINKIVCKTTWNFDIFNFYSRKCHCRLVGITHEADVTVLECNGTEHDYTWERYDYNRKEKKNQHQGVKLPKVAISVLVDEKSSQLSVVKYCLFEIKIFRYMFRVQTAMTIQLVWTFPFPWQDGHQCSLQLLIHLGICDSMNPSGWVGTGSVTCWTTKRICSRTKCTKQQNHMHGNQRSHLSQHSIIFH